MRINKFLAKCNLGSRRKVEELIQAEKIAVNGSLITDLSYQVDIDRDIVTCDGKKISFNKDNIYIMLNKPKNYLVTARDDFQRKTVFDILPDFNVHLFAIGRLDYQSEGLLLLTSDGDFANRIIHPRNKLPKVYKVLVKGRITKDQVEMLRNGVMIEGKKTNKAIVFIKEKSKDTTLLRMTIFEGRKRQIRYMLHNVGSEVLELKRLQIGDVKLGKLPVGMWRVLKPSEVFALRNYQKRKEDK